MNTSSDITMYKYTWTELYCTKKETLNGFITFYNSAQIEMWNTAIVVVFFVFFK